MFQCNNQLPSCNRTLTFNPTKPNSHHKTIQWTSPVPSPLPQSIALNLFYCDFYVFVSPHTLFSVSFMKMVESKEHVIRTLFNRCISVSEVSCRIRCEDSNGRELKGKWSWLNISNMCGAEVQPVDNWYPRQRIEPMTCPSSGQDFSTFSVK